jgi:prolipoprotein diacylglyceryltransferase
MDVLINYWAVLLSAIVAIVLGSLWYGPLFGRSWMRIVGIKKPDEITPAIKRMMIKSYSITIVTSFVMAYVLAHVMYYASSVTRVTGVDAGVQAALWTWLGFVVPATLGSVLWEDRPWKYWFITAGYYLVSLVLMGVILSVWQ